MSWREETKSGKFAPMTATGKCGCLLLHPLSRAFPNLRGGLPLFRAFLRQRSADSGQRAGGLVARKRTFPNP